MERDRLIRMANQIAENFAAYPDEIALAEVAAQINKFWTPAMRRQLTDAIAVEDAGAHRLVQGSAGAIRIA